VRPHVICVTEFKAKNCRKYTPEISEYSIAGYDLFHNSLDSNSARGVLVYVDKNISVTPVNTSTIFQENVFLSFKLNESARILLGCIYRSPSSGSENNTKLLELINNIHYRNYSNVIIVGDFNLPDINWEAPQISDAKGFNLDFITAINDNFFTSDG